MGGTQSKPPPLSFFGLPQHPPFRDDHQDALGHAAEAAGSSSSAPVLPPARPETASPAFAAETEEAVQAGSAIGRLVFPEWSDAAGETPRASALLFYDPDFAMTEMPLTPKMQRHRVDWKRPQEVMEDVRVLEGNRVAVGRVHQGRVGSCQFAAAMEAVAAHDVLFQSTLLASCIFPQENGVPVVSPMGRYVIRLHWNGCARAVVIDDMFPVDFYDRWICCTSLCRYMKLQGGYTDGGICRELAKMSLPSIGSAAPINPSPPADDPSRPLLGSIRTSTSRPRSHLFVWVVASLHCVAALEFGYNTAIVSPAMGPIAEQFGIASADATSSDSAHAGNSLAKSIIVSTVLVGSLVGALVSGSVADSIGRSKVLIGTELIFTVGAVVCAAAVNLWMLIAGRFVLGLAVGAASVAVPLMVGEIAPQEIRGQIGVLNQLGVTVGILAAYGLGTAFSFLPEGRDWRVMLGFPASLSLLHVVLATCVVRTESPRWLAAQGRVDDARAMLRYLRSSPDVDDEMAELLSAGEGEQGKQGQGQQAGVGERLGQLFAPLRPIVIVVGLMFFQQITGINAVLYYLTTFLETAGMSLAMSNYMSIVVGGINVAMTVVSALLVDRAGRRPLLLGSLAGMSASLAAIGALASLGCVSEAQRGVGSVVATVAFVVAFAVGLGPVPWCVIGEVFPSSTRALAVSVGLFVSWGTNLAVSLAYLPLVDATSLGAVFFGFAAASALALVFLAAVLPETKGRTVEDIVASMQ
eukprot:m51a1_g4863 hypothetical protein (751) ;mRNA; r:322571-329335